MILRFGLLLLLPQLVLSWGNSGGSTDYDNFGDSYSRDWLNDGSSISMKFEGCVWGYVYDSEEAGCLEDSSEDGTTSWYMMSNCRRAQAAFSLYASSSSGSCSSGNFKESFVTTVGLSEYVGWLAEWDSYSPFGDNGGDDDGNDGWDVDELPLCEEGDNGYVGLGCNDDGTFSINYFEDAYCQLSTGIYDTLDSLNYKLKTYKNCQGLDAVGGGADDDGDHDGDEEANLAQTLVYYATSCSNMDSAICTDDASMQSRSSSAGSSSKRRNSSSSQAHRSWTTKVKYVMGGFLLLASLIMFTGILFTNRRRRKALMQRKFRQSSRRDKSRSRRSQSKSRSERSRGSSRRSKSRSRAAAESSSKPQEDSGVMT